MLISYLGSIDWCFGLFFFFKQKTAYEMRISDWSSDVCSSDLPITIWQLGDAGSMFRLAPRRQAGVKRQGYRFGRPGPDPGNGGGLCQGVGPSLTSLGASSPGMVGRRSKTWSTRPNSLASSASRKVSRSIAFSMSFSGLPVYLT